MTKPFVDNASPAANRSPWRIEGDTARLDDGARSGKLDLQRPDQGLTNLCWGGTEVSGWLWGWTAHDSANDSTSDGGRPPLLDAYPRGADLVLTYGPTRGCPVETQLYWRAAPERLSLLVSIRTQVLDSLPIVRVESRREANATRTAPPSDALRFDALADGATASDQQAAVAVVQHTTGGVGVAEACHPDDQSELRLAPDHGVVGWELFSHFLEKGVIRRARLTAAFAAEGQAEQAAAEAYRQLLAEPLPLTT